MQTNTNWELWLIHDGPGNGEAEQYVNTINDDRIKYFETDTHAGNWGHSIRSEWIHKVKTKYLIITNPDNYYSPLFLSKAVGAMVHKGTTVATFCSMMAHNYAGYKVLQCRVVRGYIDCGGVLLKTEAAKEVGWNNTTDHSADWLFFNDIAKRYGIQKFVPFEGLHFIHN